MLNAVLGKFGMFGKLREASKLDERCIRPFSEVRGIS